MINMMNTRDVVIALRNEKNVRELSINNIVKLLEDKNYKVSRATVGRVFATGSETESFGLEKTLLPLVDVLLDGKIETKSSIKCVGYEFLIKELNDVTDYYEKQNEELRYEIEHLKEEIESQQKEELDREIAWQKQIIDFMKEQIERKDRCIDRLLSINEKLLEGMQGMSHPMNKHMTAVEIDKK